MCTTHHVAGQFRDMPCSACSLQVAVFAQLLRHRHHVHRLVHLEQLEYRAEYHSVLRFVEIFLVQHFYCGVECVEVKHQCTQYSFLQLHCLRWLITTVHRESLFVRHSFFASCNCMGRSFHITKIHKKSQLIRFFLSTIQKTSPLPFPSTYITACCPSASCFSSPNCFPKVGSL